MTHHVLMGDPTHFSVVGGANPHTRDRYGRRKSVDRGIAIRQWERMRDLLREVGVQIRTGTTVVGLEGDRNRLQRVQLDDGETVMLDWDEFERVEFRN